MIDVMKQALAKFERLWEIGIDVEYKVDLLPEIRILRQAIEQAEKQAPTKLFGPNLEQILNAAGFYKRDAVCCGDYKKCIEPCTPKGEWLAKQELAKPKPVTWAETNDLVCALLRQAHDVLACASYPFKRPWVSLTDEEIDYIWGISPGDYEDKFAFPRAIEAKLKEKNGG